ncbi:MAG: nucleotidyltransferase family protein [Candidatus Nanohaloarchaea archaeon]|nr:nucleotidyltransferase family protein [Candidatus Nanohaloarchaea archaeon]
MALDERDRQVIVEKLTAEGAASVELFGSYVRDEETADSDIDILVSFDESKTLLDMARIERELEDELGRPVDLVTEDELSPKIRSRVDEEKEVLA